MSAIVVLNWRRNRAGALETTAQSTGAQRLVNGDKMCGGVNAARVQHARICPGMVANGLPDTTDHDRKLTIATKATAKSGRANKLPYLIERKKTSQNGHQILRKDRCKGLFRADPRPISRFASETFQVSDRTVR